MRERANKWDKVHYDHTFYMEEPSVLWNTGSSLTEQRERKKEFGEVRQREFVGQSTKEEEAKQKKTGNTKYLYRGPLASSTYKVACVKQDQAKRVVEGTIVSVFVRLESFRFQLARVKSFLNETRERPCQELRLN